jgi:proteic killer suppression protein
MSPCEKWENGTSRHVTPQLIRRILARLERMDSAESLEDLAVYRVPPLQGDEAGRYAIDINGPWRIVFGWDAEAGDCIELDLRQYH